MGLGASDQVKHKVERPVGIHTGQQLVKKMIEDYLLA